MGKIVDDILDNGLNKFDTENFKNELKELRGLAWERNYISCLLHGLNFQNHEECVYNICGVPVILASMAEKRYQEMKEYYQGVQIENDEKENRIRELWDTSVKAEKEKIELYSTINQLTNQIGVQRNNIAFISGGECVAKILTLENKNDNQKVVIENLQRNNVNLKEEIAELKKNKIGNTKIKIVLDSSKLDKMIEDFNVFNKSMEMVIPHSHDTFENIPTDRDIIYSNEDFSAIVMGYLSPKTTKEEEYQELRNQFGRF